MKRSTLIIILLVAGFLGVCCAGSIAFSVFDGESPKKVEFQPTLPPDEGVRPEPSGRGAAQAKPTPTPKRAVTVDDGTWVVGEDIPAGTYKLNQPAEGMCYWGITKSGSNGRTIVANDIVQGGRPSVTVKKGQDFESTGCGTWTKVK